MLPSLEEISVRRRRLGLTQKRLAELAGVSQSLIAKLEAGKIDPSYTKVKAIFDVLEELESRREIRARDILHDEVVCVQKDDSVSKAVYLMKKYDYSQLPVVDGDRVVGSISERSILDQILSGKRPEELSSLRVEEVMESAFPQVDEDAPLSLVSHLLRHYQAVLVVRKGKLVGIITKADLLKIIA